MDQILEALDNQIEDETNAPDEYQDLIDLINESDLENKESYVLIIAGIQSDEARHRELLTIIRNFIVG